jgi:quercetin dioxygenase-like cupin family protein
MPMIIDTQQIEIRRGRFPGVSYQVLMSADSGSPQVQMATLMLEPGASLPLHTHPDAESFFVLEGSGVLTIDEQDHPFGPQTAMLAPAGKVHGFTNNGDSVLKLLCMHPLGAPVTKFIE